MKNEQLFLHTKKGSIVNENGEKVILRGVNFGGWLMLEGYIMGGRNISEKSFKRKMRETYGKKELALFCRKFRENFIKESDFKNVSKSGFNCIRIPFNYRILEERGGFDYLKNAVKNCAGNGVYCILDMHAVPGCQNFDWHGDSDGECDFWTNRFYQRKFVRLWEKIADLFADDPAVAGYNIMNEPVILKKSLKKVLRPVYRRTVKSIREKDKKHIIFLDGNIWSQVLEDIGDPFDDRLCYAVHYYHPLDFTFNFQRDLNYPGKINGETWNKNTIKRRLYRFRKLCGKWKVPVFVGEFGVNYRGEKAGEVRWVKDTLEVFREFDFNWTYWTYKAVACSCFPDGLYRYPLNPPWIKREGPVYGMENFYELWVKNKAQITKSWDTSNFVRNRPVFNLLAKYASLW